MMLRFVIRSVSGVLLTAMIPVFASCRFEADYSKTSKLSALCVTLAVCNGSQGPAKFGMIGDSWTDLAVGTDLIDTLRDDLEKDYGFQIVGATLAGQKMETVQETGLHLRVINEAGPEIRYMLLSLGGNDWDYSAVPFHADPAAEQKRVNDHITSMLTEIIRSGDQFKIRTWGGEPLVWFIHGYDYLNPDNEFVSGPVSLTAKCRSAYLNSGFTEDEINTYFTYGNIDNYNDALKQYASSISNLQYIDLRGSMGGAPTHKSLMFDCLHPNPAGFKMVSSRYVTRLDSVTGGVR
jgi:hypothetical protein